MSVPREQAERTIAQGAVYLMRQRSVTSPKPHFVIVMNESPGCDALILLHVVTSNVALVRRIIEKVNAPRHTAVELSPDDIGFLRVASVVNCNDCKRTGRDEFFDDLLATDARYVATLPKPTVDALVRATLASEQVSPAFKMLIAPARFAAIERARRLPPDVRTRVVISVG